MPTEEKWAFSAYYHPEGRSAMSCASWKTHTTDILRAAVTPLIRNFWMIAQVCQFANGLLSGGGLRTQAE